MSTTQPDTDGQQPPKPDPSKEGMVEVFCRYITKNGKRIYPKKGGVFHFWVKAKQS